MPRPRSPRLIHGRRIFAACIAACFLFGAGPVLAVEPDERLANPLLEGRARAISGELRCLVCQNQSIDDSSAPLARDLRVLVRERLQSGASDADVMRFVVDRYGEFVLLRPRFTSKTAILWLTPFLLLASVIFALWRRHRRAAQHIDLDSTRPLSAVETEQLHSVLAANDRDR